MTRFCEKISENLPRDTNPPVLPFSSVTKSRLARLVTVSAAVSIDGPADAELISAVRGGDVDAYGRLFARHVDAARRLARQLTSPADAEDLVSDAFAKVLTVLQRGGGPDVAFRAYLLTAVRRLHVDRIRATSRLHTTDDLEPFDPGVPFEDTAIAGFENEAAARAFASLPERWQLVLWHTEVEGQKPADVAPLLGMSANSVSALAYRAREGLRQAFLTQHAAELDEDTCRWTHAHLGAYVRDGVSRRDRVRVEDHLQDCRQCMAVYLELAEVNNNLGAILGPLLLGAAAVGYLGASTAGVGGTFSAVTGRVKDLFATNVGVSAAASVATIAAVTSLSFAVLQQGPRELVGDDAPLAVIGSSTTPTSIGSEDPSVRVTVTPGTDDPTSAVSTTTSLPSESGLPTSGEPTDGEPTSTGSGDPTDPTTGPTDPTTGPTDPTTGPTDPTTGPTDPTTGPTDPTTGPTDPPGVDLGVTAGAVRTSLGYEVTVNVTGLPADTTSTVTIRATGFTIFGSVSPGCRFLGVNTLSCTVRQDPAMFKIYVVPTAPTTLRISVPDDSNPANNTVEIPLTPIAGRVSAGQGAQERSGARR